MALSPSRATAIRRWVEALQKSTLSQARLLLLSAPAYRDLTPTQYEAALDWLIDKALVDSAGLLVLQGDQINWTLRRALSEAVLDEEPPWLSEAPDLISVTAEIPVDLHEFASALGIGDDARSLEAIWSASAKYNADRQGEVGLAAELALSDWIVANTDFAVTHVSAFDDTAGFDLDVSGASPVAHVEVKGTTKLGAPSFFISRNEYAVMARDPRWCLQLVRLDSELNLVGLQWVDKAAIENAVPTNCSNFGRWESAKITLGPNQIQEGPAPLLDAQQPRPAIQP